MHDRTINPDVFLLVMKHLCSRFKLVHQHPKQQALEMRKSTSVAGIWCAVTSKAYPFNEIINN